MTGVTSLPHARRAGRPGAMPASRIARMRRGLLVAVLCLAGGYAAAAEVVGSPEVPGTFGKLAKPWWGCPKIAGVYAWPPVEGGLSPRPEAAAGGAQLARLAGLTLSEGGYLWLADSDARKHLVMRAIRLPQHPRDFVGIPDRGWKQKTLFNAEHGCEGGWLVIEEHEHSHPAADGWYGGEARIQLRLAPLADGGLAIGQRLRVTGRTGTIGWGDARILTLPAEDRVYWHWAKLRRVADTGDAVDIDYGR